MQELAERLQYKAHRIHPNNRRPDLPLMIKLTLGELEQIIAAIEKAPEPKRPWQRFPDGKLKPFLSPSRYDELRDDDRFLYNRGPKPEGLS